MISGVMLFRIWRSVNVIAKRFVKEVAGDDSTLLVGLISFILSTGYAVGMGLGELAYSA